MEYLDIVDENGEPTGGIVERKEAHRQGIRHRTAHVWLARFRNGRPQLLLQKRSAIKDSFPGCWDISSAGHIPAGSDWLASAVRELKEELGVDADESELIWAGVRHTARDSIQHGLPFHDRQISRVYLLMRDTDDFTLQKEELEAVRWIDLDECYEQVKSDALNSVIRLEELDMLRKKLGEIS